MTSTRPPIEELLDLADKKHFITSDSFREVGQYALSLEERLREIEKILDEDLRNRAGGALWNSPEVTLALIRDQMRLRAAKDEAKGE